VPTQALVLARILFIFSVLSIFYYHYVFHIFYNKFKKLEKIFALGLKCTDLNGQGYFSICVPIQTDLNNTFGV
jgi:hypothetical protein